MKRIKLFEEFLNENANKKITVSLRASTVKSFQKDLDANNIPYTVVRPTVFELEDTPKARTAIQEAKGRFGMQSVLVKECSNEVIHTFEEFLNEASNDGGWIKTLIYRKEDSKEFTITDYKNYGSYQELFAKSKDGEEVEVTLGRPRAKDDFFQNWQTGKPA